jgi:hypothetical protein
MTGVLLAGALFGLGTTVLIAGLRPPAPDLAAGVARLTGKVVAPVPGVHGATAAVRMRAATRMAEMLHLERHGADLAITGTTATRLALEKMGYATVGLAFPALLSAIASIAGLAVPFVLPTMAGVVLAVVLSFMPEVELRRRAVLARDQMRRTVCSYLELVALERAADAGAVEALERAAAIGDGPGFTHIREALLRARLEGRTPWQQLTRLAEQLGVAELGDVADIMRLSGEDGAAVLPTLRARSASLRTWLLQSDVTAANAASERMSIPVALLGVAFMALLGFPAFARILFG